MIYQSAMPTIRLITKVLSLGKVVLPLTLWFCSTGLTIHLQELTASARPVDSLSETELPTSSADSPEAMIQALYDSFSPNDLESPSIFYESPEIMGQYFSPNLVNLLLEEQLCNERAQGICNLDFDPLSASQDPNISDLQVGVFDAERNEVVVRFLNYGYPGELIYRFENTARGWRISDIVFSWGDSLVDILSQPVPW